MNEVSIDIKEIMDVLPHRYPFLLIDRIVGLEEGVCARAIKNVTINEPFFQGHFPTEPVMPGVLILEALAQVGAYTVLSLEENKGKIAFFAGLDNVKFRKKVIPGDTLTLEMNLVKLKKNAGIGEGKAYVNGKVAAEGTFTFMF
ncbi:MAG: 3-hydroxyacyl-ACP dehydratase FabZ [Lachnospirales bacterium]